MTKKLPVFVMPAHYRFQCHACGACCRSPWRVEVSGSDLARFADHDWASEEPRFRDGVLCEQRRPDGTVRLVLKKRRDDGACIFLDDDNLCRIHKRLGGAAKPDVCRLFPLTGVRAPDGTIRVGVVSECTTWHRTYKDGPVLDVGDADTQRLLARHDIPVAPATLPIREDGVDVPWAEVAALSARLGETIARARSIPEAMTSWPDEIAATEAAALHAASPATPSEPAVPSGPVLARGRRGGRDFEDSLRFALGLIVLLGSRAMRTLEEPGPDAGGDPPGSMPPGLSAAAVRLLDGDAWRDAYGPLTPSAHDFARTVVRSFVEGPLLAQGFEVEAIVGGLVLVVHILPAYAALFARAAGREAALPEDVGRAAKQLSIFRRNYEVVTLARKAPRSFRRLATLYAPGRGAGMSS